MANDGDSLLREVDEELRREQMQKLWDRYNGVILGVAALIVLAVGGYKVLQTRRIAATEAAGSEYAAALKLTESAKPEEATKAFDAIAKSGASGYASLAKLHLAGELAKSGKTTESVAVYQTLASESSTDSLLKDFAQIQVASLKLGDTDFTEQQNQLTRLVSEDSAFAMTARELLGLAAFKAGKFVEARKYLEALLLDPKATRAIQERVKIVMGNIAHAETGNAEAAMGASPVAVPVSPAAPAPTASDAKPDVKPAETGKP